MKYMKKTVVQKLRDLFYKRKEATVAGILVNKKTIAKLNPCKDRFNNYLNYYGGKTFTKQQFMGLKNISQSDKVWVVTKLIPKDKLRFVVAEIAKTVLHIYEEAYPNDLRVRKAIEAAEAKELDPKSAVDAAEAAFEAFCAYVAAGYCDSYVAVYAAAYTADISYDIADNAAYAVDAVPEQDKLKQEKLIRKILLKYWK